MTTILSLLVILQPMPPHQDILKTMLARRDYPSAVAYYRGIVDANPTDARDLRNLARVYVHWHKYDSALVWWERALKLDPGDDSSAVGRWNALYKRAAKDSARLPAVKQLIADEAARNKEKTERSLTLAFDGFALGIRPARSPPPSS